MILETKKCVRFADVKMDLVIVRLLKKKNQKKNRFRR